jgi:FkbM family methyltransferase
VVRRLAGGQPIGWVLWHPHQKLWNWRLVTLMTRALRSRPRVADRALGLLVSIDSLLLLLRVVLRRIGSGVAVAPPGRQARAVLHIDCGPHKEGLEIVWMRRWFGDRYRLSTIALEAGREQFEQLVDNLTGIDDLDLRRAAVVGPEHNGTTATFHQGPAGGRGASLFADRGGTVEEVPAVRLSEILDLVSPAPDAVILRMNIEGAESFVIQDLVQAGAEGRIDGYYGMWDDLSKLDPQRDRAFRKLCKQHGIRNVTFNERDLAHPVRRLAIRTDIETSVRLSRRRSRSAL